MPALDAIVCGSVAVTRDGRRCGKGEGYSDLEFAILRELGHPPAPAATTVHDLQIVDSVPRDPTDQPLSVIATPTEAIRIKRPAAAPTGIDWTRLSAADLKEMGESGSPHKSDTRCSGLWTRWQNRFATDSPLEGTGFEPSVPPRKRPPSREAPRPTIVVSRDDLCLMTPSSLSVRHLSSATAERPFTRAGPMV